MKVYFDNAATTPIEPIVLEEITNVMSAHYGNPSSIHSEGRKAKTILEDARKRVAKHLRASTGEIFFTSSATESNNTALFCAVRDLEVKRIISSPTEHPCVLNSLKYIEQHFGIPIIYLSLDNRGNICQEELESLLSDSSLKTMVALMHGNNEIGTMIDLPCISEICIKHKALFHCDAVQTIGKFPIDLSQVKLSFLTASGHKIYGPKGVGLLYINGENAVQPYIRGGGQERNVRSGTENIYGIAGFAKAMDFLRNQENYLAQIEDLRVYFKEALIAANIDVQFNGNQDQMYLPHILSINIPRTEMTDLIMFNLDLAGICASAGSACSSGAEQDSHVLTAIRLPRDRKTIRFSISHHNTREEIDYTVSKLAEILQS